MANVGSRRHVACLAAALFVWAAAVPLARPAAAQGDLGIAVLERMQERERAVDFEGERTVIVFRGGHRWVTRQQVKQKDGTTKIEVISPPGRSRQEFRYGPGDVQNYMPWRNQMRTQGLPAPSGRQRVIALPDRFDVQLSGSPEMIAGRRADVVTLTPKGSDKPVRRVWVDQQRYVCLKSEFYDGAGNVVRSESFDRITFDPDIAPQEMAVQAPPGVQNIVRPELPQQAVPLREAQARAGFPIAVPEAEGLPEGYKWSGEAFIIAYHGEPVVWLRFSNGLDTISLFERRLRPGPPPMMGPGRGRFPFLVWQQDPVQFVLIGPLALQRADLDKIRQHAHLPPPPPPPK
jgi:outer membrane lipoprotein-sorting protein